MASSSNTLFGTPQTGQAAMTAEDVLKMRNLMDQNTVYQRDQLLKYPDYQMQDMQNIHPPPPPDPVVRMQNAKRTFETERHRFVRDHLCKNMPEGFEGLADKVGETFYKIEEWREDGKYVCQLSFLLDKDEYLYYKVKRTIPVPEGQSTPDITDVRGILLLSADEAALLATS